MCLHKYLLLLLFAGLATTLSAQEAITQTVDSFSAKFITTIRANEQERAYLVTDKSVYKAGEFVWFNAFLMHGISQKLSSKSKLLFVDVVDENDNSIGRVILDAGTKQLYSRILLPDTLSGGYYWLRAYTRQMASYDTNSIDVKPIYVLGKDDMHVNKSLSARSNENGMPNLSFFPEGGNMITGIDATVAIVASTSNGAPLTIDGVVKDSREGEVAKFTTNTNGLAKFNFEPNGFQHYKAIINYNGKEWSYPLPAFNYYKGQLAVTKQSGAYAIRVLLGDSVFKKETLTYVVGVAKDSLVFAAFGKGLYQVNVDENKLPPGIVTFYLFDTSFKLLSERAVYVNNNVLQVNIATDKNHYNKKDKVTLNVSVTDASQHPIPALISVSVSDSVLNHQQSCALSAVPGGSNIDNLFFVTHNCFSDEEKDLLMLTKTDTYPALIAPAQQTTMSASDSLFYISGKVVKEKEETTARIVTLISNAGNNGFFYTDTTDTNGHFSFALDSYPDSLQYGLEVKDLNNHVVNSPVLTDPFAYPQLKTPVALKQILVPVKPAVERLEHQYNSQLPDDANHLKPVMVKDEKVDYDITKRVSPFSTILSGHDFDGRTSVDNQVLRVSGLQLVNGFLLVHGLSSMSGTGANTEPLLIVNGAPVSVSANSSVGNSSPLLSYLSTLNPKDIDFIEVLKDGNAANYGVRGANGVILVNTKNKAQSFFNNRSNMKVYYATGIAQPALFPTSVYNDKIKRTTLPPDVRSTLFWNGHFITAQDSNASFIFSTSDIPTTYTVTVTGITQNGTVVYKTMNFSSK